MPKGSAKTKHIVSQPLPLMWRDNTSHKIPSVFLSDEEYGRAQQALSIVCTDIIAYNSAKRVIYLAERDVHPVRGWWWFGGRLQAGEDLVECAQRKLKTEIAAEVSAERLEYIDVFRCVWSKRHQEPADYGADGTLFIFAFEPTQEELVAIGQSLLKSEYVTSSLRSFTRQQLLEQNAHPLTLKLYDRLFGH